jgi:hypothetical protein
MAHPFFGMDIFSVRFYGIILCKIGREFLVDSKEVERYFRGVGLTGGVREQTTEVIDARRKL